MPSMFFDEGVEREDGRKYNPQVMSFIRDDWILRRMQQREGEFTEYHGLTVFCGTYNVNGKAPEEDVTPWLCSLRGSDGALPDVMAVGFQEIVDLNAANVVVGAATEKRAAKWEATINATLARAVGHGDDAFEVLMSKTLVGVQLVVLAKSKHLSHISDVQGTTAGVGVLGVMGNKGAASIRLRYDDSTICFVCSHLAAKRSHVAQRNADYASIIQKTSFVDAARAESARVSDVSGDDGSYGILDHDFVFWLGDLNYRIVEGISVEQVHKRVAAGDLEFLRDRDQLDVERAAGRVFQGFHEGAITFPPTYKYQTGTDLYEQRPDKKHRAPAWCDRILWRCTTGAPTEHVRQLAYARTEEKMSDHKPVHSLFLISVKTVVEEQRQSVLREIMRRLDKMENESIPKAKLSTTVVHFPGVLYKQRCRQTVVVKNAGEVVAHWRFVPKLEEKYVSKGWLAIEPLFGMVLPGEEAEIGLYCYVEEEVGRAVSHARDVLQDILILRLENGADFFVTVTGNYLPSCFCLTVGELVQSVKPIRQCPVAKERVLAGARSTFAKQAALSQEEPPLRVPKEVWRLIDYIYKRGMDTPAVCVGSGLPEEMVRVREALDTGTAIDDSVSVVSVGATLIELLRSLDDSVVPTALFPHAEFHNVPVAVWCRNLLQKLDVASYNTFTYVICFARELLAHAGTNELTADVAAEVFGKALLRPPMSDDMDAVATAASTMTSAPSSAALRSAGTSGAVSAVLAELLMTPSQLAAVRDVMTYFLTWTPGVTAGAAGSGGASPASGAAHDPSPLTAPPARPSTPVAVASGGSDSEGVLH